MMTPRLFLACLLPFFLLFSNLSYAQLVILQYHHIDTTTPPSTSISPENFLAHLILLQQEGMQIVDLSDAMDKIRAGEPLAEKAVAITFDDAYSSIYDNAFPLLKERHWPFTVFVNTAAVDSHYQGVMSWDQLRELQANGGLIANHSVHHPYLIERPDGVSLDDWMTTEVESAELRIRQEMGVSHRFFAYPYGEFNLEIIHWLDQHHYLAFGQQSGPVGALSHLQALPRFPAAGIYASLNTLKTKLYTLPFAIAPQQLQNPVQNDAQLPLLTLNIPLNDFAAGQLQCFASGEGHIPTQTQIQNGIVRLTTQATQPMAAGRSRYNCTAPSASHKGWYYWYSQLWINQQVSNR